MHAGVSGNLHALPGGSQSEPWAEGEIRVPAPLPRFPAGVYQARSARLERFPAFERENLALWFELFQGEANRGIILGRVPMFLRLPGKRGLSPRSRLAQLFYLIGVKPQRSSKLPLSVLRDKLWLIRIDDARRDTRGHEVPDSLRYSLVTQVLERLA
jgi:hypothetical protein